MKFHLSLNIGRVEWQRTTVFIYSEIKLDVKEHTPMGNHICWWVIFDKIGVLVSRDLSVRALISNVCGRLSYHPQFMTPYRVRWPI